MMTALSADVLDLSRGPRAAIVVVRLCRLEQQITPRARRMRDLADNHIVANQDHPLGPALAQCCGGRVPLLIERPVAGEAVTVGGALGARIAGPITADLLFRLQAWAPAAVPETALASL